MAIAEHELIKSIAELSPSPEVSDWPPTRKFTRFEYYAMAEAGILKPDEKVELLDGEIYLRGERRGDQMFPIGPGHLYATSKLSRILERSLTVSACVVEGSPLVLSDKSEPEPDLLVLRGDLDDYKAVHPVSRDVLLAVEVAQSSLGFDRTQKCSRFADAKIPEYWIVNLVERQIEVFRDPSPDGDYATKLVYSISESVSPLAQPDILIVVADVLP